jgi:hypothetical protein
MLPYLQHHPHLVPSFYWLKHRSSAHRLHH